MSKSGPKHWKPGLRFKPFVARDGNGFQGWLNIDGFGAEAVDEVTPFFETADEALSELLRRMRHLFQTGDRVEVRGVVCHDLANAESELRAWLPMVGN